MNTHVKVISVIDIVLGSVTILAGVALLIAFLTSAAAFNQASTVAAGALMGATLFASTFLIALGILGIVVGIKLVEYESWARVAQIIFGVLQLFNFPLGTAFGVYSLWAMFSDEGSALFEHKPKQIRRAA